VRKLLVIALPIIIVVSVFLASAHGTEDWTLCDLATGQLVLIEAEIAPLLIDGGTHALPSETTVCILPTEEPDPEAPTEEPTEVVTEEPTVVVTEEPTEVVTEEPTEVVTEEPTVAPPPTIIATDPPVQPPTQPEWTAAPPVEAVVCEPKIEYVYIYVTVKPVPVMGQRYNQ
jgi:hypothetical protein